MRKRRKDKDEEKEDEDYLGKKYIQIQNSTFVILYFIEYLINKTQLKYINPMIVKYFYIVY